jgi:hypothetical protein
LCSPSTVSQPAIESEVHGPEVEPAAGRVTAPRYTNTASRRPDGRSTQRLCDHQTHEHYPAAPTTEETGLDTGSMRPSDSRRRAAHHLVGVYGPNHLHSKGSAVSATDRKPGPSPICSAFGEGRQRRVIKGFRTAFTQSQRSGPRCTPIATTARTSPSGLASPLRRSARTSRDPRVSLTTPTQRHGKPPAGVIRPPLGAVRGAHPRNGLAAPEGGEALQRAAGCGLLRVSLASAYLPSVLPLALTRWDWTCPSCPAAALPTNRLRMGRTGKLAGESPELREGPL